MKTTSKVRTSKTTTKVEVVAKAVKVAKVTYLAEGVTGKDMMKNIFDANNNVKAKRTSFSQCLKDALEEAELTGTFKCVPAFNPAEMTPKNLVPLRNEKRTIEGAKWSPYEVLMLMKKFYQVGNGKKQKKG